MKLKEKVVVVTGAARGIGHALARRFGEEGAQVVCADINPQVKAAADKIGAEGYTLDVSSEQEIAELIEHTTRSLGPIDLFCSNAGIAIGGGAEVATSQWQKIWEINLMSHVWAARYLLPKMLERGFGYLMNTASAAGLLSQIGSAPYAVTKHAAVGFAEWLAITYGKRGIRVSVLCPQAVRTAMVADNQDGIARIDGMMEGMLEPAAVADICVEAIDREDFLILPHPEVRRYIQIKGSDHPRWIRGMQRLQDHYSSQT